MRETTLDQIRELRAALRAPASEATFQQWRDMVGEIDSSLQWSAGYSLTERKLMERLREGIAGVFSAHRANRAPDLSRAMLPLTALESLVMGRETAETHRR